MKRHLGILVTVGVVSVMAVSLSPTARADTITLTTSQPDEIVVGGSWQSFRVESRFTELAGGVFRYDYCVSANVFGEDEFGPLRPELSHFILEVSANVLTLDDVLIDGSLVTSHAIQNGVPLLGDYTAEEGNSNPGLPGVLHGIKFDLAEATGVFCFSFESYRVPILGSFYGKGGNSYAYNTYLSDPENGKPIWVPDTEESTRIVVPEPASMTLLGLGVGVMALRTWRKRRA